MSHVPKVMRYLTRLAAYAPAHVTTYASNAIVKIFPVDFIYPPFPIAILESKPTNKNSPYADRIGYYIVKSVELGPIYQKLERGPICNPTTPNPTDIQAFSNYPKSKKAYPIFHFNPA